MTLRSMCPLALLVTLTACDRVSGIVKPDPATTGREADYSCSNPVSPTGSFRVVYSQTGSALDTSDTYVNRYAIPHHAADTVLTGDPLLPRIIFANTAAGQDYCLMLADSLAHHLPNFQRFVAP